MASVRCCLSDRLQWAFIVALGLGLFAVGCDRTADSPAVPKPTVSKRTATNVADGPRPVDPAAVENILGELRRLTKQVDSLQAKIGELSGQVARLEQAKSGVVAPTKTTAAERLQKRITLSFPRNTLEMAMQLLGQEIGVPVVILGADLQLEGITKNQSFGLYERDQPAEQILRRVLRHANPDGKLVYLIRDVPGTGEQIVLTTRAAAAMRGEALPATLRRNAATLGQGVWMDDGQFHSWSTLISRQSLETEIKDQVAALTTLVQKPTASANQAVSNARPRLTLLSVLFQVVENYGQDVAWRGQTLGLRDACAQCAANCKDANVAETFKELQTLTARLQRLIKEDVDEQGTAVNGRAWHTYLDRVELMRCQEDIRSRRLDRSLKDAHQLTEHVSEALQQAEILAVISVVIHDPDFESANDVEYQVDARNYHAACLEFVKTLRAGPDHPVEYEPVKAAFKRVSQSCDACHADFR